MQLPWLGSLETKTVGIGEYAYVDASNEVLCRLETRQVEKTKVLADTRECFYIVQGNLGVGREDVSRAAEELVGLTLDFCGGTVGKRFLVG